MNWLTCYKPRDVNMFVDCVLFTGRMPCFREQAAGPLLTPINYADNV